MVPILVPWPILQIMSVSLYGTYSGSYVDNSLNYAYSPYMVPILVPDLLGGFMNGYYVVINDDGWFLEDDSFDERVIWSSDIGRAQRYTFSELKRLFVYWRGYVNSRGLNYRSLLGVSGSLVLEGTKSKWRLCSDCRYPLFKRGE